MSSTFDAGDLPLRISVGSHNSNTNPGRGCAMNIISWEAGDKVLTDLPDCVDPLLARLVQYVNDSICEQAQHDGALLCPDCSVRVLDLAHRTVGTDRRDVLGVAGTGTSQERCLAEGWVWAHLLNIWIGHWLRVINKRRLPGGRAQEHQLRVTQAWLDDRISDADVDGWIAHYPDYVRGTPSIYQLGTLALRATRSRTGFVHASWAFHGLGAHHIATVHDIVDDYLAIVGPNKPACAGHSTAHEPAHESTRLIEDQA